MSRSRTQFKALALPAARVPPTTVAAFGSPGTAALITDELEVEGWYKALAEIDGLEWIIPREHARSAELGEWRNEVLAWDLLTVLSFFVFWPVGLAMLAFLIGSGRMGCWRHHRRMRRWAEMEDHVRGWREGPSSGNHAFDAYRADTLRRLEDEEREFQAFLERLRFAKDKAQFDEFLAERRKPPERPAEPGPA